MSIQHVGLFQLWPPPHARECPGSGTSFGPQHLLFFRDRSTHTFILPGPFHGFQWIILLLMWVLNTMNCCANYLTEKQDKKYGVEMNKVVVVV